MYEKILTWLPPPLYRGGTHTYCRRRNSERNWCSVLGPSAWNGTRTHGPRGTQEREQCLKERKGAVFYVCPLSHTKKERVRCPDRLDCFLPCSTFGRSRRAPISERTSWVPISWERARGPCTGQDIMLRWARNPLQFRAPDRDGISSYLLQCDGGHE